MSDAFFYFCLGMALVIITVFVRARFADFRGQSAEDYVDAHPHFDMRQHLLGPMVCEGVIFGPLGRMTSTFVADFNVSWDGNTGHIAEEFRYDDGSTQNRAWTIELNDDGSFKALADDVPGEGKGNVSGSAVLFRYPITLPQDAGGFTLNAFDCMYLAPNGTVVNRSQFRKFGFKVAELVATIRKADTA
ncbi:DUF3833 domain-containing protein [Sulfitobacter sp. S190]|uniref:DUF3833 domain-containing protein n=1 Tax=Sulfitobacter sp. S190 TaxID=2867022 RepID=UPI0021A6CC5B|nr:DUF3833 domain-containing protein [Sulfitobacter sp. S190]UWR22175.1 DUF3833 domain-containing protein [Sulfitobacter sp. S190]